MSRDPKFGGSEEPTRIEPAARPSDDESIDVDVDVQLDDDGVYGEVTQPPGAP